MLIVTRPNVALKFGTGCTHIVWSSMLLCTKCKDLCTQKHVLQLMQFSTKTCYINNVRIAHLSTFTTNFLMLSDKNRKESKYMQRWDVDNVQKYFPCQILNNNLSVTSTFVVIIIGCRVWVLNARAIMEINYVTISTWPIDSIKS